MVIDSRQSILPPVYRKRIAVLEPVAASTQSHYGTDPSNRSGCKALYVRRNRWRQDCRGNREGRRRWGDVTFVWVLKRGTVDRQLCETSGIATVEV